jgi:hypothetical protein
MLFLLIEEKKWDYEMNKGNLVHLYMQCEMKE